MPGSTSSAAASAATCFSHSVLMPVCLPQVTVADTTVRGPAPPPPPCPAVSRPGVRRRQRPARWGPGSGRLGHDPDVGERRFPAAEDLLGRVITDRAGDDDV